MLEFFGKVGDLISIAINFIVNMIKSLVQLTIMVPRAFAAIVETLGLFPPFITVPIIAFLGITLTIAIINRFSG